MTCQLDFYLNNCFSYIGGSLSETVLPTATFHITKNEWVVQVLKHHQSLKVQDPNPCDKQSFTEIIEINICLIYLFYLQGMSSTLAEYWMLKEVSLLKDYGTETFRARWIDNGCNCTVAVGPQGVIIKSLENVQVLRYT